MGRLAMGVMAGVKVGGPAAFIVGDAAGSEGGLQRGVEGCRGPCHLAVGTLECHGAGLMVRGGQHRHAHVGVLLQECPEGGASGAHHITPLPWCDCQLDLDHLPLVQQGLEARHGAATCWGGGRSSLRCSSLRPAAVAPSRALLGIRDTPA